MGVIIGSVDSTQATPKYEASVIPLASFGGC